jgi:hypothetical protein
MIGDSHVRFLGEGRRATLDPYPLKTERRAVTSDRWLLLHNALVDKHHKEDLYPQKSQAYMLNPISAFGRTNFFAIPLLSVSEN